jgi:hypothetical protein
LGRRVECSDLLSRIVWDQASFLPISTLFSGFWDFLENSSFIRTFSHEQRSSAFYSVSRPESLPLIARLNVRVSLFATRASIRFQLRQSFRSQRGILPNCNHISTVPIIDSESEHIQKIESPLDDKKVN